MNSDRERFLTLKDEARGYVERITPEGRELNKHVMRLFVTPGLEQLATDGEADTRCSTCAGRPGTVPAGCGATQSDFLKAIQEDVPFMCHAHTDGTGEPDMLCHAWFAARVAMGDETIPVPWPWVADLPKDEQEGACA